MTAVPKAKVSDKQGVCKKSIALLKKHYGASVPEKPLPVLETILYGVCLENASYEQADAAFVRFESDFFDMNEIRVSSIRELSGVFGDAPHPELRALQVRSVLQYVFENHFNFEFEGLRRKTLEAAQKQLDGVRDLSPFVRNWTLHSVLGSHVVPIDDAMARAAVWLGLAEPGTEPAQVSEALKPALRKTDAPLFCALLRCLATDPAAAPAFEAPPPDEGYDITTAVDRLSELLQSPKKGAAARKGSKKPKAPSAGKKSAARSGTAKAAGKKPKSTKRGAASSR